MARNKYPEETINQILTVALNLFMQKDTSKPPFRISSMNWAG